MKYETLHIIIEDPRWKKALPKVESEVRRTAEQVLKTLKVDLAKALAEVTFNLTDDVGIQFLNKAYRKKDKPTNVLSFPHMAVKPPQFKALKNTAKIPQLLGDVIISLDTVRAEAKAQEKSLSDHLAHMVVHGLCHLLGYDHEKEKEAEEMERLEARILKQLGIANPYKNP